MILCNANGEESDKTTVINDLLFEFLPRLGNLNECSLSLTDNDGIENESKSSCIFSPEYQQIYENGFVYSIYQYEELLPALSSSSPLLPPSSPLSLQQLELEDQQHLLLLKEEEEEEAIIQSCYTNANTISNIETAESTFKMNLKRKYDNANNDEDDSINIPPPPPLQYQQQYNNNYNNKIS